MLKRPGPSTLSLPEFPNPWSTPVVAPPAQGARGAKNAAVLKYLAKLLGPFVLDTRSQVCPVGHAAAETDRVARVGDRNRCTAVRDGDAG